MPAGVTFVAASSECGPASGVYICTLASLAAGSQRVFTLTATVNNTVEPGASLENVVVVGASTVDSNQTNNSATADTSILGARPLPSASGRSRRPVRSTPAAW
jgi:hypothetical protein